MEWNGVEWRWTPAARRKRTNYTRRVGGEGVEERGGGTGAKTQQTPPLMSPSTQLKSSSSLSGGEPHLHQLRGLARTIHPTLSHPSPRRYRTKTTISPNTRAKIKKHKSLAFSASTNDNNINKHNTNDNDDDAHLRGSQDIPRVVEHEEISQRRPRQGRLNHRTAQSSRFIKACKRRGAGKEVR